VGWQSRKAHPMADKHWQQAATHASLHNAWLDLTAARQHVQHARADLGDDAHAEQVAELANQIGDLLRSCRFLARLLEEGDDDR
jgi:hypothetical protein